MLGRLKERLSPERTMKRQEKRQRRAMQFEMLERRILPSAGGVIASHVAKQMADMRRRSACPCPVGLQGRAAHEHPGWSGNIRRSRLAIRGLPLSPERCRGPAGMGGETGGSPGIKRGRSTFHLRPGQHDCTGTGRSAAYRIFPKTGPGDCLCRSLRHRLYAARPGHRPGQCQRGRVRAGGPRFHFGTRLRRAPSTTTAR